MSTATVMSQLGVTVSTEKSSSGSHKVKNVEKSAEKSETKKAKNVSHETDDNTIVITVSDAKDNRVKLPAKMFNSSHICKIDGTTYRGLESDKGRGKAQPSDFGADSGDVITFTRISGNKWESEVNAGTPKKAKAKAKTSEPKTETSKSSGTRRVKSTAKGKKSRVAEERASAKEIAKFMKKYGELAIEGSEEGHFNDKLVDFGFDDDARAFLQTKDHQAFQKGRKALGLTIKEAIELLNNEVFE